jgi:hypothetical protein
MMPQDSGYRGEAGDSARDRGVRSVDAGAVSGSRAASEGGAADGGVRGDGVPPEGGDPHLGRVDGRSPGRGAGRAGRPSRRHHQRLLPHLAGPGRRRHRLARRCPRLGQEPGAHRRRPGCARRRFPLPLRALHTDNGGELLNALVQPYCRRRGIRTTRGRAYRKNDQAWVEQRNWTAVRRVVGYGRFTSKAAAVQLAAVYALLRPYFNFFQPIRKVIAKERVGGRVRKRYHAARTPYQRLRATNLLAPDQAAALEAQYRALNPITLLAEIHAALDALRPLAEPDRGWNPTLADRIPGLPPAFAAG